MSCQLTGTFITKGECHIDHKPPNTFNRITHDFVNQNAIDVNSVMFIEDQTGVGRVFVDHELKNAFADFHKKAAALRVVSVKANLQLKKVWEGC